MEKKAILATLLGLTCISLVGIELYYQTSVKPTRKRLSMISPGLEVISKVTQIPKQVISECQATKKALQKKRYIKLARG